MSKKNIRFLIFNKSKKIPNTQGQNTKILGLDKYNIRIYKDKVYDKKNVITHEILHSFDKEFNHLMSTSHKNKKEDYKVFVKQYGPSISRMKTWATDKYAKGIKDSKKSFNVNKRGWPGFERDVDRAFRTIKNKNFNRALSFSKYLAECSGSCSTNAQMSGFFDSMLNKAKKFRDYRMKELNNPEPIRFPFESTKEWDERYKKYRENHGSTNN